jgi:hypothetical protein
MSTDNGRWNLPLPVSPGLPDWAATATMIGAEGLKPVRC